MAFDRDKAFLRGKCKQIYGEYSEVLKAIEEEITEDFARERLTGDTAFDYAKQALKREGAREGISLFIAKITKYATESARQ